MRNMWVVIKETYLRHVESWSFFFMVISPFLFLGISVGIGHLQVLLWLKIIKWQ